MKVLSSYLLLILQLLEINSGEKKLKEQRFYGPNFGFLKLSLDIIIYVRNASFFTRRIFKKDVFIIKFFTNGSYADYRVDESVRSGEKPSRQSI